MWTNPQKAERKTSIFAQCWKHDNSHVRTEAPFIIIHIYLNERTFVQESPFKELIFNLEKGFILVNVSQLLTAEPLEMFLNIS